MLVYYELQTYFLVLLFVLIIAHGVVLCADVVFQGATFHLVVMSP